jgi:hypothetical protein
VERRRVIYHLPSFIYSRQKLFYFSRIIAVNYEARACGVTRNMRGDEAKQKCPDINLVHVPSNNEKADISK